MYAGVTGFGLDGPMRDAPAYDPIIQAQTGFTAVQGQHMDLAMTDAALYFLFPDGFMHHTLLTERSGFGDDRLRQRVVGRPSTRPPWAERPGDRARRRARSGPDEGPRRVRARRRVIRGCGCRRGRRRRWCRRRGVRRGSRGCGAGCGNRSPDLRCPGWSRRGRPTG
ncbi:MAG: CoA transferase [Acidimicrobiales bacterium]